MAVDAFKAEAGDGLLPAPAVAPLNVPVDSTSDQGPQLFTIPKEFDGKPIVQVVVSSNDRRPEISRPASTTVVASQLDSGTVAFTAVGVYFYAWTVTDGGTEWQVSSVDTHATENNRYGSVVDVVPWYSVETVSFDNGGPHVPADTYDSGNLVTDSGSLYIALQDVPANTALADTAFWKDIGAAPATAEVAVADQDFIDVPDTLYVTNDGGTLSFGDVTDVDGNGDAWVDGWTTNLRVDVQATVTDPYGAAEYAGSTGLTNVALVPGVYKFTWNAGPETWLIEQTSAVVEKLDHGAPFVPQAVYPGNHLVTHQFVTPGGPVYLLQSLADTAPTDAPGSDWAVNTPGLPLLTGGQNYRTGMTMTRDGVMYVRTSHQLPVTAWDAAEQARWEVVSAFSPAVPATGERSTGEFWIGGKEIYESVINNVAINQNVANVMAFGVDDYISAEGYITNGGSQIPLSFTDNTTISNTYKGTGATAENILCFSNWDTTMNVFAILRYTKV